MAVAASQTTTGASTVRQNIQIKKVRRPGVLCYVGYYIKYIYILRTYIYVTYIYIREGFIIFASVKVWTQSMSFLAFFAAFSVP